MTASNDNLPGSYDSWRLANPEDDTWGDPDDLECSCGRTLKSRRDCVVHGVDADTQYDQWRDDQMDRDR
jgi:hypothetical protein